jgi:isoaspartyl peptidase/L-asparaginase-like protein (Ntn-hydrolase superfamily)
LQGNSDLAAVTSTHPSAQGDTIAHAIGRVGESAQMGAAKYQLLY